ncbi:HK97 gp10 family phage protein [Staphylospora marina]|uniref:HK97 gp10 family phage protein n=1 Tax=Staphylospora marina TaxID=2490858 RepID=UPI000F5C033A|nr:HK97 gp10 family phage protein [Staphylospora marina]
MTKISKLSNEIIRALEAYTEEVSEELEKAKEDVAKETVRELRKTSPKLTGDYARGWRTKKVGSAQVIYNATDYQLTHLLEHGHAKRGGGRVPGIPHIQPAEQKAIKEYTKRVEQVIRG